MILREDKYSEKVSPYLRPNFPYVCGRAATWGKPCHNGPNNDGSCGGISECRPYKEGGRWNCRRPASAGGPCEQGPMPDGSCCLTREACKPRRTIRKIRGQFSILAIIMVIAAIIGFGFNNSDDEIQSSLNPGPLSNIHKNFTSDSGCVSCHSAHNSGAEGWLTAILTKADTSDSCSNCHSFKQPINVAHNSSEFAGENAPKTECTMCHKEHRGENANIKVMSDAQCSSCHTKKFDNFSGNHPNFGENYPFVKRTAISFNHSTHVEDYFKDDRYKTNAPKAGCIGCHDTSRAGRVVPIKGYDKTCSNCHNDNMSNQPFVLFTFPEFEENPFDTNEIIKDNLIVKGLLPEEKEEMAEKLDQIISSNFSDGAKKKDEEEYEPVSSETLTPIVAHLLDVDGEEAEEYSEPVSELVSGVIEDGLSNISEVIEEAGGDPKKQLHGLSGETLGSAMLAWAANKEYESSSETIEQGWYANELSIVYNPISHGDPVMKAWIDFIAKTGSEELREAYLSGSDGAGSCTKCHAVTKVSEEKFEVEWKSTASLERPLVKYSHKPHINLLGPGTLCQSCHIINSEAKFADAYKQLDKHKFASNFKSIEKDTCTECHGSGQVAQNCLTCHNYHQEPSLKKTMIRQIAKKESN